MRTVGLNRRDKSNDVVTAVLLHFLRVNAKMRNLDKQKTAQGRKTLVPIGADNFAMTNNRMTKIITLNIICFLLTITLNGQTSDSKKYKKLELFFSCNDVNKSNGLLIDSIKKHGFEFTNKQFFATFKNDSCFRCGKYVITTYNHKKFIYPPDSIWGFRVFSESGKSNWLYKGIPDNTRLLVVQLDKMVIYEQHGNSGPKGGGVYAYFSENLCSELFRLTQSNLKEVYKNNTRFLELIKTEFKWYQSVADNDDKTKKYRIVETYKRSLDN